MNDKKNIERLFQEKFKDFEVLPPNNTWNNIASKLEDSNKNKKRRIIPNWLKASGVAASLILSYFLIDSNSLIDYSNSFKESNNKIVLETEVKNNIQDEDNINSKQKESKIIKPNIKNENTDNVNKNKDNSTYKSDNNLVNNSKSKINSSDKLKDYRNEDLKLKNQNIVSNSNKTNSNTNFIKTKFQDKNENLNKNLVGNTDVIKTNPEKIKFENKNKIVASNQGKQNLNKKNLSIKSNNIGDNKNFVNNNFENDINQKIATGNIEKIDYKNYDKLSNNVILVDNNLLKNKENSNKKNAFDTNNEKIITEQIGDSRVDKSENKNNNNKYLVENKINPTSIEQKIKSLNQLATIDVQNNKDSKGILSSNLPITNENNTLVLNDKIIDSLTQNAIVENPLDKILKDKEAEKTEDIKEELVVEKDKKWKLRPNAAPIFMSSNGGSPIDKRFSDNSKSYNNNLSIGIGLDYAMSKRFSFRTGINKFDLSYNTNEIAFFANLKVGDPNSISRGNSMPSINISQTASIMTISDSFGLNSIDPEIGQNKKTGSLNQSFGYLEFPTEISYKIIDKKFGLQLITGFSTLILNNNKLALVSNGASTDVGEANNLNPINFSSNIGIGFKYSFWKSFEANFEPTFKYQFFTFNTNSEGFKPYFIGLYSGISYKF